MDWLNWYNRWEAMQNAYLPQRQHRFNLMFVCQFPRDADVASLIWAGPGSVTFCALRHYLAMSLPWTLIPCCWRWEVVVQSTTSTSKSAIRFIRSIG